MKLTNKASLVIRTMNEKAELQAWFDYFKKNPFDGDLEIIVSDNESTDGTIELARENNCKLVITPRDEFNYPKSLNVGIEKATNEVVASVVAHAYPLRRDWLQKGLSHFDDNDVAGVYGSTTPSKNASIVEWIFYGTGYLGEILRGVRSVNKFRMGVFGATNIIIRKSLWVKHHFNEKYAGGGEDGEWARWAFQNGYHLITDPAFSVRHSHGLHYHSFLKQFHHWESIMTQPSEFNREEIGYKKHLRY